MKKRNIGSSFDSWLREEGLYEEVTATAIKPVLARQVEAAMREKNFSKAELVIDNKKYARVLARVVPRVIKTKASSGESVGDRENQRAVEVRNRSS